MSTQPYQFPSDIEDRVKARIAAGAYQDEDQVIREAMNALDEREREKELRWHDRNQIAIDQSRAGLSKPLDLEAMLARVEKRLVDEDQAE